MTLIICICALKDFRFSFFLRVVVSLAMPVPKGSMGQSQYKK